MDQGQKFAIAAQIAAAIIAKLDRSVTPGEARQIWRSVIAEFFPGDASNDEVATYRRNVEQGRATPWSDM